MKKIEFITLLTFSLFLNGCLVQDECDDCQSALQHMAEKIEDYACNPGNLQTAWDNIRNSCSEMVETYVGYMAESCEFAYLETPECGSMISDTDIMVVFYAHNGIPGDLEITIQYPGKVGSENFVYTVETNTAIILRDHVAEDDEITRSIYDAGDLSGYYLHSQKQKFTFARNGNWHTIRGIYINYDKTTQKYSFTFNNWGNA